MSLYLDKLSGEIISIDGQYLGYAEELSEEETQKLPDWEQDEVRSGIKILKRRGVCSPFLTNAS